MASKQAAASRGSRRAHEVPGHGLGGTDRDFFGVIAEDGLDGHSFEFIIHRCGGPVSIDIVNIQGEIPASSRAIFMQLAAPAPPGAGLSDDERRRKLHNR